jgi:hypothetical protein
MIVVSNGANQEPKIIVLNERLGSTLGSFLIFISPRGDND